MSQNRGKLAVISMCILVFILIQIIVNNRDSGYSPESEPRRVGIPNISNAYATLERCSIDQIVEDSERIYVLYGEHEGNVQVFNHNGEHLYSAFFATHLNGAFNIATKDGILYVRDEHHNLYMLQNGKLLSFYYSDAAGHILDTIEFHASSSRFIVRFGSIWRVDGDEFVCIVKRSPVAALYQGNLIFCITLLMAIIIGMIGHRYKKNMRSR